MARTLMSLATLPESTSHIGISMRIVIFTPWFYPHLGGVETVSDLLAMGLCEEGCDITLITTFPSDQPERERPYNTLRQPGFAVCWRAVREADLVLMFGPSLRFIWIPLVQCKPLIVNHYTWTPWRSRPVISLVQRLLCMAACNIAPSQIMARQVGLRTSVMPNPFDDQIFHPYPDVLRDGELVFLGRLVEEKGLQTLLHALRLLMDKGLEFHLTIIGEGHAEDIFKKLANKLGLHSVLSWRGAMTGEPLARELAKHGVLVVPSLWREPFGIVAVEGLACGCEVVVSSHGGLMEAVGQVGVPFIAGNAVSLADAILRAHQQATKVPELRTHETHLAQFRVEAVARRYIELSRSCMRS